jgi:hypothetical protein
MFLLMNLNHQHQMNNTEVSNYINRGVNLRNICSGSPQSHGHHIFVACELDVMNEPCINQTKHNKMPVMNILV